MLRCTFWEVNNDGVGYIRIKKFSKNTAKDFRLGLKEILKNPNTKGLVVDLRGNTGGLLSNALNILDQLVLKLRIYLKQKVVLIKQIETLLQNFLPKCQKIFQWLFL